MANRFEINSEYWMRQMLKEGDRVPFSNASSLGIVEGVEHVNVFGRNTDIDIATAPEDIWGRGGLWVPPTTPQVHTIVSTSTNDVFGGTGARQVTLFGLDENYDRVSETINISGTTPVASVNQYAIIDKMWSTTVGSLGYNEGAISATASGDAVVTAEIDAQLNESAMAIYGVPRNTTFLMNDFFASLNVVANKVTGTQVNIGLLVRENLDQADSPLRVKNTFGILAEATSYIEHRFDASFSVIGPAFVLVRIREVFDDNIALDAGFDGIIISDAKKAAQARIYNI